MSQTMRTHTEYDVAHLEELQRVVDKAVRPGAMKKTRFVNLGWGLVCLAAAGVAAMMNSGPVLLVFLGVLALFFLVRGALVYRFTAMGIRQSMDKNITGSDYVLEKEALQVTNAKTANRYAYIDCARLLETEKSLYFMLAGGQALILDKGNLKGGSVDALRTWMEEKCQKPVEQLDKRLHPVHTTEES